MKTALEEDEAFEPSLPFMQLDEQDLTSVVSALSFPEVLNNANASIDDQGNDEDDHSEGTGFSLPTLPSAAADTVAFSVSSFLPVSVDYLSSAKDSDQDDYDGDAAVVESAPSATNTQKRRDRNRARDRLVKERQREVRMMRLQHRAMAEASLAQRKRNLKNLELQAAAAQYGRIGLPLPTDALGSLSLSSAGGDDFAGSSAAGPGGFQLPETGLLHDGAFSIYTAGSSAIASKGSNSLLGKGTADVTSVSALTADRAAFVSIPPPGLECYICRRRQDGCPLCWEFPSWGVSRKKESRAAPSSSSPSPRDAGSTVGSNEADENDAVLPPSSLLQPLDYAFSPGAPDVQVPLLVPDKATGNDRIRPPLHTPLTTESGLRLWRGVFRRYTTLLVKTIPSGAIVTLVCDAEHFTVSELYELFRSNSCDGDLDAVHLYLPTDKGCYSICNQDEQETELLNANINAFEPLAKFNIGVIVPDEADVVGSEAARKKQLKEDREAHRRALAGMKVHAPSALVNAKAAMAATVTEDTHGPYAKHPPVSLVFYPWYSSIEASDAWTRRGKPAMATLRRFVAALFDAGLEPLPDTRVYFATSASVELDGRKGPEQGTGAGGGEQEESALQLMDVVVAQGALDPNDDLPPPNTGASFGVPPSIPGDDRVQERLGNNLVNELATRQAVARAEEREDSRDAKRRIEDTHRREVTKELRATRDSTLRSHLAALADEIRTLQDEQKVRRERRLGLEEAIAGTKEELRRLDRLIVSSQRATRLKPSDYKTIKLRQEQFDDIDFNRLALEEQLRTLLPDLRSAAKRHRQLESQRRAVEAKIEEVKQVPVRLPTPRRE